MIGTIILPEHDLGECEKTDGFLCDECRQWYLEQDIEWAEETARYYDGK